jgi:hypothetical protein
MSFKPKGELPSAQKRPDMASEELSFVEKLFPSRGVTPKHVAGWVTFGWTHLPPSWIPNYVLMLAIIAVYVLPLFMSAEKAFNRVLLLGMLLFVSQFQIPNFWDLLKNTRDLNYIGVLLILYGVDYALSTGAAWSALDKKGPSGDES